MPIFAMINKKFKLGGAYRKVRGEKIKGGVEKFTLGIQ
jgi:hypothetical protein